MLIYSAARRDALRQKQPFRFTYEPLFERVSTQGQYADHYLETDIPENVRVAKRTLDLAVDCPFSDETRETLANLVQGDPDWLRWRNRFISSSRFAVAVGEHPQAWEKAINFWRESTGRIAPKVFGPLQQGFLNHGKHFEPIARSVYERITNCGPLIEEGMRIEMRKPYIYSASPDGVGKDRLIEIKCKAKGCAVSEPPYYYLPQIVGAPIIYEKPFSDFVGYWARHEMGDRLMVCSRVYTNQDYWEKLRVRLDYMAWCIVHDVPATGTMILRQMFPLPELRIEPQFYYEGWGERDDDPTAKLIEEWDEPNLSEHFKDQEDLRLEVTNSVMNRT